MKIILNYDPNTQQVTTDDGLMICTWPDLEKYDMKGDPSVTRQLVELRAAGFTVGEIMQLKREGMA